MKREIVVGSTWAHGNGEETVTESSPGFVRGGLNGYGEDLFRRLFRWVRDPEPDVKVGTWWRLKKQSHFDAIYIEVLSDAKDGFVKTLRTTTQEDVSVIWLQDHYEPCEPPPREKAVEELVKAVRETDYSSVAVRRALRAYEEASK